MSAKLCFVNGDWLGRWPGESAVSRSWSFGDKCVPKPELGNEMTKRTNGRGSPGFVTSENYPWWMASLRAPCVAHAAGPSLSVARKVARIGAASFQPPTTGCAGGAHALRKGGASAHGPRGEDWALRALGDGGWKRAAPCRLRASAAFPPRAQLQLGHALGPEAPASRVGAGPSHVTES